MCYAQQQQHWPKREKFRNLLDKDSKEPVLQATTNSTGHRLAYVAGTVTVKRCFSSKSAVWTAVHHQDVNHRLKSVVRNITSGGNDLPWQDDMETEL